MQACERQTETKNMCDSWGRTLANLILTIWITTSRLMISGEGLQNTTSEIQARKWRMSMTEANAMYFYYFWRHGIV